MKLSAFGKRLTSDSGILNLMTDLGNALAGDRKKYMLGGGNPALIPEIAEVWRAEAERLLADQERFDRALGQYDTPQGRPRFMRAVAGLLRREFGWDVGPQNIGITNGSQSAFFMLFALLAGPAEDGSHRRVHFPLMPEYIGYCDQPLRPTDFSATLPIIDQLSEHEHKYRVDFDNLELDESIAAVCVSRPTNPTGNVITDHEIAQLAEKCRALEIPLMIDNAYGTPFPDIIFVDAKPHWDHNTILALSLSKIGLPALRTGIIVANEQIIRALSATNAVLALANGSMGQVLTEQLFESGRILELSRDIVRPYYREKRDQALECVHRTFYGRFAYSVHKSEGSLFLWIWFPDLPSGTSTLYSRLQERDVVIVPGKYFAFGEHAGWKHADECIRVNYALNPSDVQRGIEIIAEEVEEMWSGT
ncbi:MAG: valine--pyruvate transaminase [Spirochaetales bacterium]